VALTDLQIDLLSRLRSAVERTPDRRFVYRTEWLGYLPSGLYHWIEVGPRDISGEMPTGWSHGDLEALTGAGLLAKVSEQRHPTDEYDRTITYEVLPGR
jgi:hypothetical protein